MSNGMKAIRFFMFRNQNSNDALVFSLNTMGNGYKLSRNFSLKEAQSKCGTELILVHPSTIVLAQTLRDNVGAIKINSWYRSLEHNKHIGGTENSKHTLGMAIDVVPLEAPFDELKSVVEELNIGGVGYYPTFIHLDVFGENRRWTSE